MVDLDDAQVAHLMRVSSGLTRSEHRLVVAVAVAGLPADLVQFTNKDVLSAMPEILKDADANVSRNLKALCDAGLLLQPTRGHWIRVESLFWEYCLELVRGPV